MKIMSHTILSAILLALLTFSLPSRAVEDKSSTTRLSGTVTSETLQVNIREVEASNDLDEATRKKLVELYRSALTYLEQASSHDKAAKAFRESRESAPARARSIREELVQTTAVR